MIWEDERYVRLYTRDTVDWLGLSFLAQGLFCLLLRKVNRAGLLPLGKHGKKAVVVAIGHPGDWPRLEGALEELLADGSVQIQGDVLVIPNFVAAQEAKMSGAARTREWRERQRDGVTGRNTTSPANGSTSHGVTQYGDGSSPTRDATGPAGDAERREVTGGDPSLAVPSRTVPNQPSQPAAAASENPQPDLQTIPDAEAALAKTELEQRLQRGEGKGALRELAVSAKLLHADTVQRWIERVRTLGRQTVVEHCYEQAGNYWRRTSGGEVDSLRFFLTSLERLKPAQREAASP